MTSLKPVDALSNLMAPTSSYDASLGLAGVNGVLAADSFDSCLVDAIAALVRVTTLAGGDQKSAQQISNILTKPFDELGTAITDLFAPDASPDDTVSQFIADVGEQLVRSVKDPFSAVIESQSVAAASSVDQVRRILFTGDADQNGFFVDYFHKTKTAVQSLFLTPSSAEGNILSVFMFAFEHGVPALDAELFYLKQMRTFITTLNEQASKLPDAIDFVLPNFAVNEKLCEAETLLVETANRLRLESKFDRARFNRATGLVCSAQDTIFDGKFDQDLLIKHSKDFLGLSQYKNKDLAALRFLPNVEFKLHLQALQTTAELFKQQELAVTGLYFNITSAASTIRSLADTQLGPILALLVDVIRRQIGSLRLELQIQAVDGIDIASYLSSQVGAYLVLDSLCRLMNRAPSVYGAISEILRFESVAMRTILELVSRFDVSPCGNPQTGQQVLLAVQNYLLAADNRLREEVKNNDILNRAGRDLILAIKAREDFLTCMRSHLFFGLDKLADAISLVSNGVALLTNLKAIARNNLDFADLARTLNLRGLTGVEQQEFSALDALLKAMQCLLLNCDNPMLQSIGRDLTAQLADKYAERKSSAFTMSSLDQIPKAAAKARDNTRLQQIMRVLAAVKGILSLDLDQICNSENSDAQTKINQQRANGTLGRTSSVPVQPGNTPAGAPALVATPSFPSTLELNPPVFSPSDTSFTG